MKNFERGLRSQKRREWLRWRATVPMLWDTLRNDVVNNESADIIDILNSDFNQVAKFPQLDLSPPFLRDQIQRWNDIIYPNINNGVYRSSSTSFHHCLYYLEFTGL
jgi:putative glutathione S-transferase